MIRRWTRRGVRLGLLIGIAFAVVKLLQRRQAQTTAGPSNWDEPWTPPVRPVTARVDVDEIDEIVETPEGDLVEVDQTIVSIDGRPVEVDEIVTDLATGESVEVDFSLEPQEGDPEFRLDEDDELAEVEAAVEELAEIEAALEELAPQPEPEPEPAAKPLKARTKRVAKAAAVAWIEPSGDTCPTSHPIKAKLSSKIFHEPGMFAYQRTRPDRCYADPGGAAGDGFTRAKR